ncbi:hypothetical protein DH2020_016991 [Rehmannia glutinosa]|uniref:Amino acid transporter transmembrane domain-containing protein n=1 Tax=Rehmannia glutinosa TaxID=99300 RepID=A0ABR0WQ78_REHGL
MGVTDDTNEPIPLLQLGLPSPPVDDLVDSDHLVNASPKRTGVIGSGVLSLAWSMAQLGWIWGPVLMLLFAAVTLASTFLLCNCYRSPDPDYGPIRNRSYIAAVKQNLVKDHLLPEVLVVYCFFQIRKEYIRFDGLLHHRKEECLDMWTAYTDESLWDRSCIYYYYCYLAIQKSNCYYKHGQDAPCESGNALYMLLFGVVQIFMSQIPDFHSMEWLSIVAAIMSFTYSSIGMGLGAAKVIGNKVIEGSVDGVSASTAIQKVWRVSQAVGDIAFAFPYSMIVLEIQDTLKSPPSENRTMKKASVVSIGITTFFYLSCGGFGYAAFGDQTPGDLLTGFGTYGPYWLIDFANSCVVLHLIGGYQVYSQPLFAMVDKWLADQLPRSSFVNRNYTLKLPVLPYLSINLERLCFRTAYVASTTAVAMIFPYFNQVLGVLGTINFWPLSIYFPVEMWLRQKNIRPWSTNWIVFRSFSIVCFVINMFIFAGSIEGIMAARFS